MGILFDDGSSEYLEASGTCGISGYPFTFSGWVNPDAAVNGTIVCIGDNGTGNLHELRLRDPGDTDAICNSYDGGSHFAKTSASYNTDVWQHVAGVWAANQDRRVYLAGGNKGTNVADSMTWQGSEDITQIGTGEFTSPSNFFSGMLAEAAIWSVALSDAEVAWLATGIPAWWVQPANIVAYWPMHAVAMLQDLIGGNDMTAFNTPADGVEHPTLILPPSVFPRTVTTGAPPASTRRYSLLTAGVG